MWNQTCANIFKECVEEFNKNNIRYFVLRNYQNLPEENIGKDVDIIVEPKKIKLAKNILKKVYCNNGAYYYDEAIFDRLNCMHGMSIEGETGIHIDLIGGYLVRGYEIYTFDQLYENTKWYNGFCVLDEFFDGIMLLIYKQFGYGKPKFKDKYKEQICQVYEKYPEEFGEEIARVTSSELSKKIIRDIKAKDFDTMISYSGELNKQLKRFARKKAWFKTVLRRIRFLFGRVNRAGFSYRKYIRCFAVLAPDGTGKTTFLEALIKQLNYYYVSGEDDGKFNVYHFRPTVLPNLGAVGEKAGVMEQDKDWTNPHRNKPANPLSSLIRIAYYSLDYIIGWQKCVRKDVHCDRYSIFDRYSYDFIVDPLRTKLGLPKWVRRFFVRLTPQPKIVFVLQANPDIIYARKQELTKDEITRQLKVYKELADSHKRFRVINAEQAPEEMAKEAIKIIFDQYTKNLKK